MSRRTPGRDRGHAPGGHRLSVEQWALQRQVYLDNLKVLLIAAIIAIHAILGYAATIDVWPYASVREVTLWPSAEAVLFVVVGPFAFFMIALLFLVAGLLTRRRIIRPRLAPDQPPPGPSTHPVAGRRAQQPHLQTSQPQSGRPHSPFRRPRHEYMSIRHSPARKYPQLPHSAVCQPGMLSTPRFGCPAPGSHVPPNTPLQPWPSQRRQ